MIEASDKLYHIVLHSKENEVICRNDQDYTALENCFALAIIKSKDILPGYSVMSTHAHTAMVSTDPRKSIKRIKLAYTRYFNSKYGRSGSLFEDDTYCEQVNGYLRQRMLLNYILRNPIHHGICETAFRYMHSSIGAYFQHDNTDYCQDSGKVLLIRKGTKNERYPVDNHGRIPLKYFVNAGWTEHLYRTERSFLNSMNRWNTEDWEKEQKKKYPEESPVTLQSTEPGFARYLDEMKAYERGSFQPRVTDLEICRHIDQVILPGMGITSYTCLDNRQKYQVLASVTQHFGAPDAQIRRCLRLPVRF